MEIETAARKHLLAQKSITNLVQDRVWKFKLPRSLEGTGDCAIVVRRNVGWAAGMGSQEYPILVVDCYADNSRPTGEMAQSKGDREERAMQLAREVDRVLHQVDREVRWWPDENGLQVLGSFRSSEPSEPQVRDGVVMVRVTYDVQAVR